MYTLKVDNPDKLFFTSDTHIGHSNIIKYCNRPYDSRSSMDKSIISLWNSVVPEDGIVVHCGDFMLPHDKNLNEYMKYIWRLNGRILLLRGNHDRIDLGIENEKIISVQDKAMIYVDGVKIYAEHYPCLAFNGNYQVFGHIHTLSNGTCTGSDSDVPGRLRNNQYDVGVDQNGYKPISYRKLCEIFRTRMKNKK